MICASCSFAALQYKASLCLRTFALALLGYTGAHVTKLAAEFWSTGFPNITNPDSSIQVNLVWKSAVAQMPYIDQEHLVAHNRSSSPVLALQSPKMKAARNRAAIRLHDRWAFLR